jgi:NADPH:quinone reductase
MVSEITQRGSTELRDVAQPLVTAGECLVKIEAAGVNSFDTLMMRGLYQVKPLPFTPGAASTVPIQSATVFAP